MRGPKYFRFPRYQVSGISEELKENGWTVWRIGQCPSLSDDVVEMMRNATEGSEANPILTVETYLDLVAPRESEQSPIARMWDQMIGFPLIPGLKKKRQKMLGDAFWKLEDYIKDVRRQTAVKGK